jgi:hypothetical protein
MIRSKAGRSLKGPVCPYPETEQERIRGELLQGLMVDAQLLHHPGAEIVEDHVGGFTSR